MLDHSRLHADADMLVLTLRNAEQLHFIAETFAIGDIFLAYLRDASYFNIG
ncbi:Uncharacterised protein [Mycobacterium tuberculosis]|nr:Uncharacterised protein [Mycobacterium tuberculosis]